MESQKDKEQQLMNVAILASLAENSLTTEAKDHIKKNHMSPTKQGKSYFLSSEETFVWRLIQVTCNFPDISMSHRSDANRHVLKKKFNVPVGIHGKTGRVCLSVTVIYDIEEQRIVTAFPTV